MIYKTKQKDEILNIIQEKNKEFTIKDIYNDLGGKVGLTTIYRLIDKLVREKQLNKFIKADNTTYYEYLKSCSNKNHFYLKCVSCSKLIHIDCSCIEDLENHILNVHKFNVNKENIIINGLCSKCQGGN